MNTTPRITIGILSSLGLGWIATATAAQPEPAATAAATAPALQGEPLAARLSFIGQVQPRAARDIVANDWSVGAEAQDRDYSTYAAWRAYLGPLGAKRARLQSGWQRTDLGNGNYNFAWLDPVIDDMRAQGVAPWLCLCYGNDRYPGGGVERRDSPLPSGEGRKAWLAYARATAARYKGRIAEYEIWNEPDLNARVTAEEYGQFAFETARTIREADPKAGIILGAFAHAVWGEGGKPSKGREFARVALEKFVQLAGRGFANAVTYHAYNSNPDKVYGSIPSFRGMIHTIDPALQVRQGENGAPSLNQQHYALRNEWWTEEKQAKWLLRRMLGDAARGIPTSIFTMTEMHYPVAAETNLTWVGAKTDQKPAADSAKHFKGLLETRLYAPGTPEDDRTIVRTKAGYVAMQAVTAIFDSRLKPLGVKCDVTGGSGPVSAHVFRRDDGAAVLAVWRHGDIPGDKSMHELVDVRIESVEFGAEPRYVDLLTRATYRTRGVVQRDGAATVIRGLPIYDSPVLITHASLVHAR